MTTIAKNIEILADDAETAINIAQLNKNLVETEQDWNTETTTFIFNDKSKLEVSGPTFMAH